jgi:hypothetical protein
MKNADKGEKMIRVYFHVPPYTLEIKEGVTFAEFHDKVNVYKADGSVVAVVDNWVAIEKVSNEMS